MRFCTGALVTGALLASSLAVLGGVATAGAAGGKSPITIGYINSLTGVASSTYDTSADGVQAVIDAANATGGVAGHPLKLIVKNDNSTAKTYVTAAKELVSDGVTLIVTTSSFTFGGASYLAQQHVPVVGNGVDGPEWGEKGYTNMFDWSTPTTPFNGKLWTTTAIGKLLKSLGVKSYGGLGYGISPSSSDSILEAERSAASQGIKTCYTNNTVTFGAVTFTSDALQIGSSNCGAISGSFVLSSDIGLSTAMKDAGLTKVVQIYFTGYTPTTTATAANRSAFDGNYALSEENFSPPNSGGRLLLATLKKYDSNYHGGVPSFGTWTAAVSAQLAVYGLGLAGQNPTSSSFSKALRKVTSWNDTGFLGTAANFTHFGTTAMLPKTSCEYFEKLTGTSWKSTEECGTLVTMPAPSS